MEHRDALPDATAGLHGYTRDAYTELDIRFPRLPNPILIMYVFPHLSGELTPVPGLFDDVSALRASCIRAPREKPSRDCPAESDCQLRRSDGETGPLGTTRTASKKRSAASADPSRSTRGKVGFLKCSRFRKLLSPKLDLGKGVIGLRDLQSTGMAFEMTPLASEARDRKQVESIHEKIVLALCNIFPQRRQNPWLAQVSYMTNLRSLA